MPVYVDTLPATRTVPHAAVRWSPAENDYSPVCGLLVIENAKETAEFVVTEFPTGWRGRGFTLARVGGTTNYDVFCSADGPACDSCDCPAGTYRGACRHVVAVRTLIGNNWL